MTFLPKEFCIRGHLLAETRMHGKGVRTRCRACHVTYSRNQMRLRFATKIAGPNGVIYMHKTKQAALKAARADLGDEAIEGVDFNLKQTGAGWTHESIPPANDAAAAAQAERLAPPAKAKGPTKRGLGGKPSAPKETREQKRLRMIAEADARNAAKATAPKEPKPKKAAVIKATVEKLRAEAPKPPKAPKAAKPKKAPAPKPAAPEGHSKTDMLVEMLSAAGGATSKEMEAATGWQPHSVRGLLGTLRKRGVNVVSKKLKGEPTIYRISAGAAAASPDPVGDVV